ncbi:MAG: hypothetical protein AB7U75_07170 [Hyphomicrobiaceae bacterium]
MTPTRFSHQALAADAFEALIENTIIHTQDLYDLDGETFLKVRSGTVETFDESYAIGGLS